MSCIKTKVRSNLHAFYTGTEFPFTASVDHFLRDRPINQWLDGRVDLDFMPK